MPDIAVGCPGSHERDPGPPSAGFERMTFLVFLMMKFVVSLSAEEVR